MTALCVLLFIPWLDSIVNLIWDVNIVRYTSETLYTYFCLCMYVPLLCIVLEFSWTADYYERSGRYVVIIVV